MYIFLFILRNVLKATSLEIWSKKEKVISKDIKIDVEKLIDELEFDKNKLQQQYEEPYLITREKQVHHKNMTLKI